MVPRLSESPFVSGNVPEFDWIVDGANPQSDALEHKEEPTVLNPIGQTVCGGSAAINSRPWKDEEANQKSSFSSFPTTSPEAAQHKGKKRVGEDTFETIDILGDTSPPTKEAGDWDGDEGEDDWEIVNSRELDDDTLGMKDIPTAVLQDSNFRATTQGYIDHFFPSQQIRKELRDALWVLKFTGGIAYTAVSETVMDVAANLAQRQFGCDFDEVPAEVRVRLLGYLPESTRNAIRRVNQ